MKKVSSVVWQFFDRLEENKRCVAVLCKLCDSEYKYFGNTTNLRAHLIKKHPLQWEFRQNNLDGKTLEEQPLVRSYEEDENTNLSEAASSKRRKRARSTTNKSVEGASETEIEIPEEEIATINLVRQMHDSQESDEEWLEEDMVELEMFEPTRKKPYRRIKREVMSPSRKTSSIKYIPHQSPKSRTVDDTKKDEYSVFGEYIANKLRKFKTPRTRGNIQQIITTIMWQAEYGLYDDADAVKRVLLSSIQYTEVEQQTTVQDASQNYAVKVVEETNQCADSIDMPLCE